MNIFWILPALVCGSFLYSFVQHRSTKKLCTIVFLKLRSFNRPKKHNANIKKNDDDVYSDDEYLPPCVI